MRNLLIAFILLAGGMMLPQTVSAADRAPLRYTRIAPALPFPRSEQAQAVRAGDTCLRECGAYCAWGLAACLRAEPQGQCLTYTDSCDRYCQVQCRFEGGPLLPLLE